ncbi:MAG: right-handed parallel beta-helix repeat-containing protein [Planctomycetia bacterium]|nr:right-handed parallel beta-helix repeat-containing protein [Planctomycetia bacterium]
MKKWLALSWLCLGWASCAWCATYYVSPTGDDSQAGTSPQSAWQSLAKVNKAEIVPGDRVLFERGGIWRGILRPASGEKGNPVYYGAYGKGEKPTIYGSIDASNPNDWEEVSPGLWSVKEIEPQLHEKIDLPLAGSWNLHREAGAAATIRTSEEEGMLKITVECQKGGTAPNHIQLWGPEVKERLPETCLLRLKARCSAPYVLPALTIQQTTVPWPSVSRTNAGITLTDEWQTFEVLLSTSQDMVLESGKMVSWHASLGQMPTGCVLEVIPLGLQRVTVDRRLFLSTDVGNIIFDHGKFQKYHTCGVKKWSLEEVKEWGDYHYDRKTNRVYLKFEENPGKLCQSVELAMRNHGVNQGGCHDVVYENLAVAYAAAHGFGGGNTARITIRKCDLYYIGGGDQYMQEGRTVRFGNAIEFWNSAEDSLVEENRIWEVYDAAITNQGKGSPQHPSIQRNITYRNNLIWNSEYSFEYWNRDGITENIVFENNLCFDAGVVWSHAQRPNPNGAHMMFYNNGAPTKNFIVRNNVFCNSTEVCLRMDNDWRSGLILENNVYWQDELPVIRFLVKNYYSKEDWKKYQEETGMDKGSILKKVAFPAQ